MKNDYRKKTPTEKIKFWEEQIRFWRESGLSQNEYCKRHGISQSQWFYWRKRCQDTEAGLTLVPVKVKSLSGHSNRVSAVRIITPNGFTIEFDTEASPTSLPHLIREVSAI